MTSTITRTYERGDNASDLLAPYDEWCGAPLDGYRCSMRQGHDGPQHVAMYEDGQVCAAWDNEEATPVDELTAFRTRVRELAQTICRSRGYGTWPVWNDTMVRLGLEPFTVREVRVVAPVSRVVRNFGNATTEEEAREWLNGRRHMLSSYLSPLDDELGEPTVEVEETTPREDEDVEADPDADTDDLDTYKALVRGVAIDMATNQSWCDDGLNGVLDELGLGRKGQLYDVEVRVVAAQTVTLKVRANSEDEARSQIGWTEVDDAWSPDAWTSDDYTIESVYEVD
jgi:hypothetical protein